jgi:prepilin-type N-terminal cleavage/methylation domain-containing protein
MLARHLSSLASGGRKPPDCRPVLAGSRAPLAHNKRRRGFTLIELLVVIGIVLVLAAIAVFVLPSLMGNQRGSEGASQLQGWLLIAKQRALRDQAPRGIRLNIQQNGQFVTDLQYIEQPPDFGGGQISSVSGTTVNFTGVDFYGGNGSTTSAKWPVQVGDYLEMKGGGPLYQITGINSQNNNNVGDQLAFGVQPVQVNATSQYRIIRAPRPLAGEDALSLPQDVAIDLALSRLGSNAISYTTTYSLDILFSRTGTVVGQAAQYDKVIFWVRDITLGAGEGDQSLITIYSRTNGLASHPANFDANVGAGDAYYFTRDGRSSGQ